MERFPFHQVVRLEPVRSPDQGTEREHVQGTVRDDQDPFRGLWGSPPSFLGVYGWQSWSAADSTDEPLSELLSECYVFIFVHRLQSLKAHLEVKPNIDGLVFLNLRNFLYDRQRQHDPLGLRVFEILQSAVRQAVRAGELYVLAGDSKIRNDSLLGFTPDTEPVETATAALGRLVGIWNDDLLPALVTARGKAVEEVVARTVGSGLTGGIPELSLSSKVTVGDEVR